VDSVNDLIMVSSYDPESGKIYPISFTTARSRAVDDHDHPSIAPLPNGNLYFAYCRHGRDRGFYHRYSRKPAPESIYDITLEEFHAIDANTCYTNIYYLTAEKRLHYFGRALNNKPTWLTSNDLGKTWSDAKIWIVPEFNAVRPYVHYASNGIDRIDMIYTDGHPRNEKNSIYHAFYKGDRFRRSSGDVIKSADTLPMEHEKNEKGTYIYRYSEEAWGKGQGINDWIPFGRAWVWDIELDSDGNPVCVISVQLDASPGEDWTEGRIFYYYAWWDGSIWKKRCIAQAGNALYKGEDDFAGGITLDPSNPSRFYMSSNSATPFDLSTLKAPLSGNNYYKIYRGEFDRASGACQWSLFYDNPDNMAIRPFIPETKGPVDCLIWMEGPDYPNMKNYPTGIAGWFSKRPDKE
ncbi:BNR-4 repeat-containing protein, partial [Candidatus Sumerlaeota bacterium]|nr:BNR-4 repeat-containing protein [Candidatus Sumerlaeota bacterium]